MKILFQRVPISSLAKFIWHDHGRFLMRLVGINIYPDEQDRIRVEPVYLPAFTAFTHPGQLFLEFPLKGNRWLVIVLQKQFPWISIETSGTVLQDIDEEAI